jgi:hypothetical protein
MKKGRILQIILIIIFFGWFIIQVIPQFAINTRCVVYDDFLKLSLNGIVKSKYIDSSNHSFPTIEIKNFKSNNTEKLLLDLDTTNLYNQLNIGDTIFKSKNKDAIFRIESHKQYFISKVNFGCSR